MATQPSTGLGYGIVSLLANPKLWVTRRVETVHFVGEEQIRRSVSVDFDASQVSRVLPVGPASFLTPLALLAKHPLALLDVTDEHRTTLPVMSTEENGFVAYSALAAAASIALKLPSGESAGSEHLNLLETIARAPIGQATQALHQIKESNEAIWRNLWKDDFFRKLARDLAVNFILLAYTPDQAPRQQRRILKFSFAIELGSPQRTVGWRRWLRIGEQAFAVDLPSIADGASYHVQILPPGGLTVGLVELYLTDTLRSSVEVISGSHLGGIGHVSSARAVPGSSAEVLVTLTASPRGIVSACAVASVIITLLLCSISVVSQHRLTALDASVSPVLAVLLAVPTLIAAYLARPGEISLVSRILRPVRLLLFISALSVYSVSVTFALDIAGLAQRTAVLSASIVSVACSIALCASWKRGSRASRILDGAPTAIKPSASLRRPHGINRLNAIRIRSSEGKRAPYDGLGAVEDLQSLISSVNAVALARSTVPLQREAVPSTIKRLRMRAKDWMERAE